MPMHALLLQEVPLRHTYPSSALEAQDFMKLHRADFLFIKQT